jgi:putative transposase
MGRKYNFRDQPSNYFVFFTTVYWVDVFTRRIYKDLLVDSLNICVENKCLNVYENPVQSGFVENAIDYPYNSANIFFRN